MHQVERNRTILPMSVRFYDLALDGLSASVLRSVPPRATLPGRFEFGSFMHFSSTMTSGFRLGALALVCSMVLCAISASSANAQVEDALGDGTADPVKLFERAQAAHARGNKEDLEQALAYYEEALKVKPDFPEAEFQMGNVLLSLRRLDHAESAFRRAIMQRKNWSLPYTSLGVLLARTNRDTEAEITLRQALKLDSRDNLAARVLASIRLRSGDAKEALNLARLATLDPDSPASAWLLRALAERAVGDKPAARTSLQHVLETEPENPSARIERAELYVEEGDYENGLKDLKALEQAKDIDKQILGRIAAAYEKAGKSEEAQRIAVAGGLIASGEASADTKNKVIGTKEEIEAANSEDQTIARAAIAKLIEKNPKSALLFARLGASYRTDDPVRSLEFYRRATGIEPANPEYATGYAAALVRSRRFADAIHILKQVLSVVPDSYVARANLATALYEQKRYAEAIPEYEWLLKNRPDLSVAYYFIASAHDYLGEYKEAQTAYDNFLRRADTKTNQLEIDKVNLRLPSLRRQIQLGQGVKRKQ
jgi:tetratricopeptide (TPR) repeat protein